MATTLHTLEKDHSTDNPKRDALVNRVQKYLSEHPEVSQEEFLRSALERELEVLEEDIIPPIAPTPEEIRDHEWIEQGLNAVRRRRRSFSERMRDALQGHC
jgi:hypothetical protein